MWCYCYLDLHSDYILIYQNENATFIPFHIPPPATESVLTGTLNAIVHTAMYCYYFMSIYDAKLVAQFVSIKQRLTQIQLVNSSQIILSHQPNYKNNLKNHTFRSSLR